MWVNTVENQNSEAFSVQNEPWHLNSVAKAIRTLQTFTVTKPEWTLTQLSRELNISKSTMINILKTLQSFGYIIRTGNNCYRLGVELLELSYHLRASLPILHYAIPLMEDIQHQTEQIIYLTIPKQGMVFYLQSVNPGNRNISYSITGKCSYMHSSACGKAMLSALSDEDVDLILHTHGMPRATAMTIVDPALLKKDLELIRTRGFSIDNCEDAPHVVSLAVPIVGRDRLLGALSISGSMIAMNKELFPQWAGLLSSAAAAFASYEDLFPRCEILP